MQQKEGWRLWDEAGWTWSVLTVTELDVKRHITDHTEIRGGKNI